MHKVLNSMGKGNGMTYDELLAKLNRTTNYISERMVWGNQWHSALLAVVELHKPDIPYGLHDAVEACPIDGDVYPCSTIQAIEKGLG